MTRRLTALLAAVLLPALAHAGGGGGPAKPLVAIPADFKLEEAKFKDVGDPKALFRVGDAYLAAGDKALAQKAYSAAYAAEEVNAYASFANKDEQKALLEGRLGNAEGAEKLWDKAIAQNPMRATIFISLYAPPDVKEKLLAKSRARLEAIAKDAEANGKATAYLTSKGEPRYVEKWDDKRLAAAIEKGEPVNLAYVPVLDLRQKAIDKPLKFTRSIIGKIHGWESKLADLDLSDSVVLGEAHFGKRWEGEVNKSKQLPPARFTGKVQAFNSVWLGPANFEGVKFGKLASFPFGTFTAGADFRAAEFGETAEFRFSNYGGPANFKGASFLGSTYLGHTRFDGGLTFTKVRLPKNRLYFNSTTVRGDSAFDEGEWMLGATFEGATFEGKTTFAHNLVRGPFNFSRAKFQGVFDMVESVADGVDFFGAEMNGPMKLQSNQFFANVRFSIDSVTRKRFANDLAGLDAYYKLYHGDEDVETEINPGPQYGVVTIDDLTAKIHGDISLANSIFKTFLVMERVEFGTAEKPIVADFFNTQFGTESHFERTSFHGRSDFQTIFGQELAFNDAVFHGPVIFDDANVPGRLTFTGASFEGDGNFSAYGAVIGNLGLEKDQIVKEDLSALDRWFSGNQSKLFYERCAKDASYRATLAEDRRLEGVEAKDLEGECMARTADEYSSLRAAFEDSPEDSDWAYWWMSHHKNWWSIVGDDMSVGTRMFASLRYLVFEKAFGWGVHLGNILFTAMILAVLFVFLFRAFASDSIIQYDGDDLPVREIPFHGLLTISVHCLLNTNIGWDGGSTDRSWKILSTTEAIIGIILLTFFVGAYTRMVLA